MASAMEPKRVLRGVAVVVVGAAIVLGAGTARAQIAGSSTIGITMEEMKVVALGWSAKKNIIGKPVFNDENLKIGVVDDLIIAPDRSVSYAIIGVGGFLGLRKHDVAVPVSQLKDGAGKITLPGATKEALKAMPKFEYAN